jgi:hypothetical protein
MTTPRIDTAFLILTSAGLAELDGHVAPGAAIFLNPGIAAEGEIARLREAGARVQVLPRALPAAFSGEFERALHAAGLASQRFWIEHAPATGERAPLAPAGQRPAAAGLALSRLR